MSWCFMLVAGRVLITESLGSITQCWTQTVVACLRHRLQEMETSPNFSLIEEFPNRLCVSKVKAFLDALLQKVIIHLCSMLSLAVKMIGSFWEVPSEKMQGICFLTAQYRKFPFAVSPPEMAQLCHRVRGRSLQFAFCFTLKRAHPFRGAHGGVQKLLLPSAKPNL